MLADVRHVASLIRSHGGRFVALTGAGCSTESGIPDYRSPGTGLYTRRPNFQPLTIQKFMKNDFEKKRYWGRSIFGYTGMSFKSCNKAHVGLHLMSQRDQIPLIITQNVDGLHHLARHGGVWRDVKEELYVSDDGVVLGGGGGDRSGSGSDASSSSSCSSLFDGPSVNNGVLCELHGNIHVVRCMHCGVTASRADTQKELVRLNAPLLEAVRVNAANMRPDADYELDDDVVDRVTLLKCAHCGHPNGHMRPDVVLFGENVPEKIVNMCFQHVDDCPVLVCFGTSLQVFSSYRFAKRVAERPDKKGVVIIVNRGPTRADSIATCKVDTESVGEFIEALAHELD